jgi:hypothetical protein
MSFPPEKPFNPPVSKIPMLGPSSGNPKALRDPNSTASVGKNIQALTDQASADTLYDAPMKKEAFRNERSEGFRNERSEGFRNEIYSPWILRTEACSKEGFSSVDHNSSNIGILALVVIGIGAIMFSFSKRK